MTRVALIFHRFGPYHHARLRALNQIVELVGIELSAVDETYAWSKEPAADSFRHVTLFHDQDIMHKKGGEILRRVHGALDDIKPEAVAIPGWFERGALAALIWCIRNDVPAIVMSESTAFDGRRVWWKEAIKRRFIRFCQAGLVGGAPHKDYLAALGMAPDHIFVGYDVVDNDFFCRGSDLARTNASALRHSLGLPDRFFLASNRFIDKKNLSRLLRAYNQYRASTQGDAWKLVLLGDGELRKELEQLREDLGLREDILLPGFKQYQDLPAYYGLASAFVHASTLEQWGLVVNEAMAAGLPVIVSRNCGCAADLVRDGVNGFQFDPLDVDALARLLTLVAQQDDAHLQAMGKASREIIAHWGPAAFEKNLRMALDAGLASRKQKSTYVDRLLFRGLIQVGRSA